jgi:hypothetical protein
LINTAIQLLAFAVYSAASYLQHLLDDRPEPYIGCTSLQPTRLNRRRLAGPSAPSNGTRVMRYLAVKGEYPQASAVVNTVSGPGTLAPSGVGETFTTR